jgi:hypothetical protein
MIFTPSVAEQARDVSRLTAEEAACLVKESASLMVLGIFPAHYVDEPWRAHLLRGEPADDVSGAVVLRFPNSMACFRVKQILRRHERGKSKPRSKRVRSRSQTSKSGNTAPLSAGEGADI